VINDNYSFPSATIRITDLPRGFSERNLEGFREFYRVYPQILQLVTAELPELEIGAVIPQSVTAELQPLGIGFEIPQKASAELQSTGSKGVVELSPPANKLVRHFSFSHFVELMRIADPLKRAFYEIEGIKGCWSVPQLKRQIESQLYERTGLSKDKKGLVKLAHATNPLTGYGLFSIVSKTLSVFSAFECWRQTAF
jgi:hypothetical protein